MKSCKLLFPQMGISGVLNDYDMNDNSKYIQEFKLQGV